MNYQDKTKEELIKELQELEQKYDSLKTACKKDFIERKQSEEAFLISEKKYKDLSNQFESIIDHIPGLVFYKDTKNNFIHVNKYFTLAHKMTKEELEGKNLADIYPKEDAEKYLLDDLEVINSGIAKINIEEPWMTETGLKWVNTSKIPFKDETGKTIGIIGLSFEITERKQAEEKLKESEAKFKILYEAANDAIFIMNEKVFLDCNPRAEILFRCTKKEDIVGHTIAEFSPLKQPDGQFSAIKALKKAHAALTDKPQFFEWKHLCLDGTPIDSEVTLNKVEIGGVMCLQAIVRDITERKQTEAKLHEREERYRTLFKNSPGGIMVLDENGTILEANEIITKLTLYNHEELVGSNVSILVSPEKSNFVEGNIKRILAGETIEQEVENRKKDGTSCIVLLRETAVKLPNGQLGILSISNDISERKQKEQEIKDKNQQLQKTNAEKDKFFSILAHDLRSPLSGFAAMCELMANNILEYQQAELQQIVLEMRDSAHNIYNLLENLLEWSQLHQGMISFTPKLCHLSSILNESIAIITESAKIKGIKFTWDIPDSIHVYADVNMLRTVIRNLASNALKYTEKGGEVYISAMQIENKIIKIAVCDSGIGMSNTMINNLFRIDINTSRPGTEGEHSFGLGLILCKEFIENHGGKIWVESKEAKGTTVSFSLPAIEEEKSIK